MKLVFSLLLFAVCLLTQVAQAGSFSINSSDGITYLRYKVKPPEGKTFTLNFTLLDTQIKQQREMLSSLTKRSSYLQQLAANYLFSQTGTDGKTIFREALSEMNAIKQQAISELPGFRIKINSSENKHNWKLGYAIPIQQFSLQQHSIAKRYSTKLKQAFSRYEQRTDAYEQRVARLRASQKYEATLYSLFDQKFFTDTNLQTNITGVDYGRIALTSSDSLVDLARAMRQLKPPTQRAMVDRVLTFMQSIPYDTLGSRSDSRAYLNGFFAPAVMLSENRGDCDIKTTAMASLLKQLTPNLKVAIIIIPGHALLGVSLKPQSGDELLDYQNTRLVLMEPVGPVFSPIGDIDEKSKLQIQSGRIEGVYLL